MKHQWFWHHLADRWDDALKRSFSTWVDDPVEVITWVALPGVSYQDDYSRMRASSSRVVAVVVYPDGKVGTLGTDELRRREKE